MNGLLYYFRNMDHFADISCIIIILVMRDLSDAVVQKINVRSCKRKFCDTYSDGLRRHF